MNEKATANPLGTERVGRLMVRYATPSIISLVVNSLYNMVDQVFIGQDVGYLGNAATNVVMPMTLIMMALSLMLGDGGAAYMSLNLGKGKPETAAKGIGVMASASVVLGVVVAILFELFLEPLCGLFGATQDNLPYALEYGRIIVLGFPFFAISSGFAGVIRADGRPNASMIGLLIGCATNLILDPVFIFVCGWGVAGAAWATILGQILNAIYFVICFFRFRTIKLERRHFRPDWTVLKKICLLGVSSFITQVTIVFVMAVMNNLLVKYGALSKYGPDIPLAALGITVKVSQLITSIVLGFATGIQPIFGFNYGSKQYERVKKTYKIALLVNTLIMVAGLAVFQIFPESIISLFGQESELYMEFAVKCFRIYLLMCILIPAVCVTGIFFQALGKPVRAAVLSLTRQIIFLIPAMFLFSALGGVEGMLWAGPFSDGLSGVCSLVVVLASWKGLFGEKEKQNG